MQPETGSGGTEPVAMASESDVAHLKLLAIFHFVYAGCIGLFGCLAGAYILSGVMLLTADLSGPNPPPRDVGWLMIGVGKFGMFTAWGIAACVAISGGKLRQHRSRLYCMVVAVVLCINVPLGTALGVFTLVVLSRPRVRQLFGDT